MTIRGSVTSAGSRVSRHEDLQDRKMEEKEIRELNDYRQRSRDIRDREREKCDYELVSSFKYSIIFNDNVLLNLFPSIY